MSEVNIQSLATCTMLIIWIITTVGVVVAGLAYEDLIPITLIFGYAYGPYAYFLIRSKAGWGEAGG